MKSIRFDPYFQELKDEIMQLYLDISNTKGVSQNMTMLFYHLLIHRHLTQKQLRKLTGFSLGYISETLNYYLEFDVVSRSIIEGTNEYIYHLQSSFLGLSKIVAQEVMKDLHLLQSEYYLLLSQYIKPDSPMKTENKTIVVWIKRLLAYLDDFEQITQDYFQILEGVENDTTEIDGKSDSTREAYLMNKFDEIITQFADSKTLPYTQSARKKLFAAMIAQNEFTKPSLQKMVKISYKTFQEHFDFFHLQRQILAEIPTDPQIAGNSKNIDPKYRMKPITQILQRNITNTSHEVMTKIHRLMAILQELEQKKETLHDKAGYTEIKQFIQDYFEISKLLIK